MGCWFENKDWLSASHQRIAELAPKAKSLNVLDLSGLGMNWDRCPGAYRKELLPFAHVEKIDLSKNYIDGLQIDFRDFPKLKQLDLSCNPLGYWGTSGQFRIREEIHSKTLQYLKLSDTHLGCLDLRGVDFAESLEHLDLSTICFENIVYHHRSEPILRMDRLPNLRRLDLSYNQYSFFPKLNYLPALEYLDLSGNPIRANFPELLRLRRIKHLFMRGNGLKKLPAALLKMPQLRTLDLRFNPLPEHTLALLQKRLPDTHVMM